MGYGFDVEDFGGDLAAMDFEEMRYIEILEDIARRERNLKNKYVITCIGNKSKKECYLQDRRISNACWWTKYLSNAIGCESKDAAIRVCEKFKYNDCGVKLIQ